jgi:hypothetical protein
VQQQATAILKRSISAVVVVKATATEFTDVEKILFW